MIMVIFNYWDNNYTFDNFDLQEYINLRMINNNHYTINTNINNNSNNNNNDNHNKNKCGNNNVCKIKLNGHNIHGIKLVQLITNLLVLVIITLVIFWIFVITTFRILIFAAASFELESFELALFESVLFEFVFSNISLWLMFDFNKQPFYFDYMVLMELYIMIMRKDTTDILWHLIIFGIWLL